MADITVRRVKFDFPDELDDVFPGVDIVDETYLVAFSLTMPYLEPYLIRTFRAYGEQITDPELAADVKAFSGQEAQHFQNHKRVNDIIKARLGPEVAAKLQAVEDKLDADYRRFNERKSMRFNTVYVEGFEAMTCAMAMGMVDRVKSGEGDGRMGAWQQLWAWHAAEEIEHRTVAFDVYEHLVGSYPYRIVGSLRAQWHFHRAVDRMQRILLRAHGERSTPRLPPWLKRSRHRYLRTFKRSYHPADLDVDPLIDMVLAQFA